MNRQEVQKANHPPKGSSIKVYPIRQKSGIERIKKALANNPRDLALFTLGINTAFRACDILSIHVGQVRGLDAGETLELKERKTKSYRPVTLNSTVISAISNLLQAQAFQDDDYLFSGQRKPKAGEQCKQPLQVSTLSVMVKAWCKNAGLQENYGSHTMRKTWGYMQRVERRTPIPLLMEAFGHATQRQTLEYLCIQDEEIAEIYELEL